MFQRTFAEGPNGEKIDITSGPLTPINLQKNLQKTFSERYAETEQKVQEQILNHFNLTNNYSDSFRVSKKLFTDPINFSCNGISFNYYDLVITYNCSIPKEGVVIIQYNITIDKE